MNGSWYCSSKFGVLGLPCSSGKRSVGLLGLMCCPCSSSLFQAVILTFKEHGQVVSVRSPIGNKRRLLTPWHLYFIIANSDARKPWEVNLLFLKKSVTSITLPRHLPKIMYVSMLGSQRLCFWQIPKSEWNISNMCSKSVGRKSHSLKRVSGLLGQCSSCSLASWKANSLDIKIRGWRSHTYMYLKYMDDLKLYENSEA